MTIDEVVAHIMNLVEEKINKEAKYEKGIVAIVGRKCWEVYII